MHIKITMQSITVKTDQLSSERSLTSSFPSVLLSRCSEVQSFLLFLLSVLFILMNGGWVILYNSNISVSESGGSVNLDGETSLALIHGEQTSPQIRSTNTKTDSMVSAGSTPWLPCCCLDLKLQPELPWQPVSFQSITLLFCLQFLLNCAVLARQINRRNSLAR